MVDIIIPAYNAHESIGRTLLSIYMQTIKDDIKVYLIDDCSDIGYDEIVKSFKGLLNITLLKMKKNSGPGLSRQLGLEHSNSEYVMFLDSDDLLHDCFSLSIMVSNMDDYDVCVANVADEGVNGISFVDRPHSCLHAKLYRKSFIDQNNIHFNDSRSSEDNGFHKLFLLADPRINEIHNVTYFYSYNKNSITQSDKNYSFDSLQWYIYNMVWAIKNGIERNFKREYIAELTCSSLYYVFFRYLDNKKRKNQDMILDWSKELVKYYNEYNSYINDGTKFNCYKDHFIPVVPEISVSEFINLVEKK